MTHGKSGGTIGWPSYLQTQFGCEFLDFYALVVYSSTEKQKSQSIQNSAYLAHLYFTVQDICLLPHISIKSTRTSSSNPLLYTSRITTLRSLQHLSPRGLQHSLLPLPLPPNLQAPLTISSTPLLLLLQLAQLLQLHLRRLARRRLRL